MRGRDEVNDVDIDDATNLIVATSIHHRAVYDILVALVGVNEGLKRQNDGLRIANAELVARFTAMLELQALAEEDLKNRVEFMRRMAANYLVCNSIQPTMTEKR
ncbi:hypothetical protein IFR05_004228 [Cadophora sp. M221]|nr:hypothetical protein IFR05_004228 [Cadophora sp. M221]